MAERSITETWLREHGYELRPDGWHKVGRVAPNAKCERSAVDESVGTDAGEASNQERRIVRITSYRVRLVDERNLFDKHFVDALVEAGLLVDDSPTWAKVFVEQIQIRNPAWERTEIEITADS